MAVSSVSESSHSFNSTSFHKPGLTVQASAPPSPLEMASTLDVVLNPSCLESVAVACSSSAGARYTCPSGTTYPAAGAPSRSGGCCAATRYAVVEVPRRPSKHSSMCGTCVERAARRGRAPDPLRSARDSNAAAAARWRLCGRCAGQRIALVYYRAGDSVEKLLHLHALTPRPHELMSACVLSLR